MLIYDTLYGLDDALVPRPQMVAGHVTEPDGLRWTLTLRDGLKFHDGERVLAAADDLSAPDDKTILFRLKYKFPQLPAALAKYSSPCVIMPARLISGSAFTQVTDPTGSGPFRFLADQRVAGSRLGYAKFEGYVPRDGQAQGTAGAKIAHFERVEWNIMPAAPPHPPPCRTARPEGRLL